jgi:hypothetical protein
MRNFPINLDGQRCECGAIADEGKSTCRKCRNRARWLRRKARHGHEDAL